ncbi:trichohyalin-like [Branchiostoma lanceolatum]|uniref:trichohyalin-like n=1 Tax=Branchiostoma lanceolatum TaxID=7740 RepID=UPI003453750B
MGCLGRIRKRLKGHSCRKKKIKPCKESHPPNVSRLGELQSSVPSAVAPQELQRTSGRAPRMHPYQERNHSVVTVHHQTTGQESRLIREKNELRTQLQQKTDEGVRIKGDRDEKRRKDEEIQDWIRRQWQLQQRDNAGRDAKRELELRNERMKETLRQKDAEIAQMKESMDATERLPKIGSQRQHQAEHNLRQSMEISEKEATRALKEKNDLTQKINTLQKELATKDERMGNDKKQTEAILQQKERELDSLRTALGTENQHLRTQVESLTAERDSLQTTIDSLKAERESIRQQYTEVKAVAENFQYRLSNEFCIRLASDETNMENISVKHRPAKIAEKFAQIESKEWVEAKEVLDERFDDEKTNIQILLFMLKFACKCAQQVFDGFLSSEACRLYNPVATTTDILLTEQNQNSGGSPRVPGSILKEITAFLKGTCGDCDIESLMQSVVDKMKEVHGDDIAPILQDTHVRSFVQACCRLSWQMAVQQPPLTVLTSNTHYDDKCHQLWYNSPPPSKSKGVSRDEIDYYIWPELRHSDKVLKKGRVCLKPIPR